MNIQDIFVSTKPYLDNLYLREGRNTDIFQTGNILLLDRNNMTRKYIDEYLSEHQIVPGQVLEVNTMDILIELDKKTLVTIPMKWPIKKRTIGFAYNPGGTSRALEDFLSFCDSFPIS